MTGMGFTSKALDKLPSWAKFIFMVFAVFASVYYISHYGFLSFLLNMLFKPVP
jgi:nitrate reductase NapE component